MNFKFLTLAIMLPLSIALTACNEPDRSGRQAPVTPTDPVDPVKPNLPVELGEKQA